jgi:hypothetical protein
MYVSFKTLKQMIADSFDSGHSISLELKDEAIEDIIRKHKVAEPQELRIYTVDELRRFPIGSKFYHSLLGRGEIVTRQGVRGAFMQFENKVTHAFAADQFPWDLPMLFEGSEETSQ